MGQLTKENHLSNASEVIRGEHSQPRVAILLCTYNGQEFLQDQLDSIKMQTHTNWTLYVSDDDSTDDTLKIVDDFAKSVGEKRVVISNGPQKGFAANFLSLIHHDEIEADYFSFADQDDLWLPEKLEVALDWLEQQPKNIPSLYCSPTIYINADGRIFGKSDLFLRPPSFANALVQNIGGGNTMVFNKSARNLVGAYSPVDGIISHDWWIYILVSGNAGLIKYDPESHILYRQHIDNLVGMNGTWLARMKRVIMLFSGRFRYWNDTHEKLIKVRSGFLTMQNHAVFKNFCEFRNASLIQRVLGLSRSTLYRQTTMGNLGLFVGNLFKKI